MKNQVGLSDFGKRVKIRLIELNMTQTELANKLGIKKQYLNYILTGKRSGEKYIVRITKLLDMKLVA